MRDDQPSPIEVGQPPRPVATLIVDPLTPPHTKPTPWHEPDIVRAWLAGASLAIFALTIAAAFLVAAFGSDASWTRVTDLLEVLIPIETLIIGGAVSFYYASRL